MERNGCTHTEKASKVVKDVDLSYLTLTALTLERMKRKRGVEEEGQREKKSQEAWRRRRNRRKGNGRINASVLSIAPLFFSSSLSFIFSFAL